MRPASASTQARIAPRTEGWLILAACFRQRIPGADRRSIAVFIACGAER